LIFLVQVDMRLSVYEIIMLLAIFWLLAFFVTPRVIQGSPEVRASQAVALQLELEKLQEKWQVAGGLSGAGEDDHIALTTNMIKCFTSPTHIPYNSKAQDRLDHKSSWVRERVSRLKNPSDIRLSGFSAEYLKSAKLYMPDGKSCQGVLLGNTFVVLFDGQHWQVAPVQ